MIRMSINYPLKGGIPLLFNTLKIDPNNEDHLAFFSLQLTLLPFCADRPRWWTMTAMDGSYHYVKVNIRPAFLGIAGRRITRHITFLDCAKESSTEIVKVARQHQIELVNLLLNCPGRGYAIRAKSKPARILDLASDLIFRSASNHICGSLLESRFSKLIKITKGSQKPHQAA